MIINSKQMLQKASREKYAVGAFNIFNMESLQAALEAAKRLKSPVIVQTTESAINYAGMEYLLSMVKLGRESKIPIVLHLDHGRSVELIRKCISSGYNSVMFDGSELEFGKNIKITRKLVNIAHKQEVSVEAELGQMTGVEDNVGSSSQKYTDPEGAKEFVDATGCDSLAVSIGNAHGAFKFKGEPRLHLERLKDIKNKVKIPLVLHGGSAIPHDMITEAIRYGTRLSGALGVPDSMMKAAIRSGISKVNIDSDIRLAFHLAVREFMVNKPGVFDPRAIFGAGRDRVVELIMHKMRLFGCAGKG